MIRELLPSSRFGLHFCGFVLAAFDWHCTLSSVKMFATECLCVCPYVCSLLSWFKTLGSFMSDVRPWARGDKHCIGEVAAAKVCTSFFLL